jgi:hypothetical protein
MVSLTDNGSGGARFVLASATARDAPDDLPCVPGGHQGVQAD